jgi:hypothetical protein
MTRAEQLTNMEQRVRSVLREAYLHAVARIGHPELAMCLGRERATKGFHSDIERLWINEMELIGYDKRDIPALRYCWVPDVNEWVFEWLGSKAGEKLDWKIIGN